MENLSACTDAVTAWYIRNDLLLNTNKIEGTRRQLGKFDTSRGVAVSGPVIPFVRKIWVLGVDIDGELACNDHIISVVRSCNYHIRALRHTCNLIDRDTANTIACSIVCSRLDYCNAILYGVTEFSISRLQRVQNPLTRTVGTEPHRASCAGLRRSLHWLRCTCAGLRRSLHWLPVKECITYKVAAMTFKARFHHKPIYVDELLVDLVPSRSLRSKDKLLLVELRTKTLTAFRAFRVAGLHIWNALPLGIRSAHLSAVFEIGLRLSYSTKHTIVSRHGRERRLWPVLDVLVSWTLSDFWKASNYGALQIRFDWFIDWCYVNFQMISWCVNYVKWSL